MSHVRCLQGVHAQPIAVLVQPRYQPPRGVVAAKTTLQNNALLNSDDASAIVKGCNNTRQDSPDQKILIRVNDNSNWPGTRRDPRLRRRRRGRFFSTMVLIRLERATIVSSDAFQKCIEQSVFIPTSCRNVGCGILGELLLGFAL
jgi:hypothetical protein